MHYLNFRLKSISNEPDLIRRKLLYSGFLLFGNFGFSSVWQNGNCLLYSYKAGTTQLLATYSDKDYKYQNTNPIELSGISKKSIWLGLDCYRLVLMSSNGNVIWDVDNFYSLFLEENLRENVDYFSINKSNIQSFFSADFFFDEYKKYSLEFSRFELFGDGRDETNKLIDAFNSAAGRVLRFDKNKVFRASKQIVVPDNSTIDFNGSRIVFSTNGAQNNLIIGNKVSICNGIVENSGDEFSGHGGNQCPITIGDYGTGIGSEYVFLYQLSIITRRPNGNGILVTGSSRFIRMSNLNFPSGPEIGRPILIHWGGADLYSSVGTTHPNRIDIENITTGDLSFPTNDGAAVFISSAYDVNVKGVFCADLAFPIVQVFAGDFGGEYAPMDVQNSLMTGILIEDVNAKSCRTQILKINNKSKLLKNNLTYPGPFVQRLSGKSLANETAAVLIENVIGGQLLDAFIEGGGVGIKLSGGVMRFVIKGGVIRNPKHVGVFISGRGSLSIPPEDCIIDSPLVYKHGKLTDSKSHAAIDCALRTVVFNSVNCELKWFPNG